MIQVSSLTKKRLPNAIHDRSQLIDEATSSREFGGFCCSFSPCGTFIAWTSAQQYEHKIIVERFLGNPNGRKTRVPIVWDFKVFFEFIKK